MSQMTALDLLIILQRFRTLVVSIPAYQVHGHIIKPVLDEFDAACEHLKSRYQEEATKINLDSPAPCRDVIYMQGYNSEGKATFTGYRGSVDTNRDHTVMDAAIELYYAAVVRKQDNITPMVLWRHVMGSEWVPPEDAPQAAESPTIHYDVVFEFANKHNLQYNDIAAMISRALEPRPAAKELL